MFFVVFMEGYFFKENSLCGKVYGEVVYEEEEQEEEWLVQCFGNCKIY